MITAIMVALAVTVGALILHISFTFGALRGYNKGLDDAEQIAREVREEFKNASNDKSDAARML